MIENKVRSQSVDPSMRAAWFFFSLVLLLGFYTMASGWRTRGEPRGREAETLVSAQFVQQENDFSLAYPVPTEGRSWLSPVEFPFFQWTAVVASKCTGLELTGTGRAVALLCFYLTLPALFLVLRSSGLTPAGGLVVLGVVASNPYSLGQAAAFQGESMTLMFAVWFLAGIVRALVTGHRGWFGLAILAGGVAGMMNGRTLWVSQLLALGWSAGWFWRNRKTSSLRVTGAWWCAVALLPWLAVGSWVRYAAGRGQLDSGSPYLPVIGLEESVFARLDFSSDLMGRQLELIGTQVVWWPLLLAGAALAITFSERWWRQVAVCTGCFFLTRLLFPVVQEQHLHELMAGTVCLLVALGLVLMGLFDPALPRWAGPAGLILFCIGLAGQSHAIRPLIPTGPRMSQLIQPEPPSINQLGRAIQQSVPVSSYLITMLAPDAGLRLPLATRRRTLNLATQQVAGATELHAALAAFGKGKPGAVVLNANFPTPPDLVTGIAEQAGEEFQLAFTCGEWSVYLPKAGIEPVLDELVMAKLRGVAVPPEMLPDPQALAGEWREFAQLWRFQRANFNGMQPAPFSFYSTFGPAVMGDGTEEWYNAHPVTRLRFRLPPGPHRLQTRIMMKPEAFDPSLPAGEMTDGVEFQLAEIDAQDNRRVLHSRLIDPANNAADRQPQAIDLPFVLPADSELEISFGPGPARRTNRDWIYLGRLRID